MAQRRLGYSKRVLFVVDRHDWAFGTVARELADSLPQGFEHAMISMSEILTSPLDAWRQSREAAFVHFLGSYLAIGYGWLGVSRQCLVNLTHIETNHDMEELARMGFHRFIAMSELTAEVARKAGIEVEHVCRPGAPVELTRLDRPRPEEKTPSPSDTTVVGFSGKLSSDSSGRKGLDILVAVVTAVAREVALTLRLCGEGWERFAEQLRANGVSVELVRPRNREEALAFFRTIDIYLCTSRLEGGPLPLIEAMAAGCCVISTRVGFVPEVITSGVNGVVCEVDDIACLTSWLHRLCSDGCYRAALGRAAAAHVREAWYWGHDQERVHATYDAASGDEPLGLRPRLVWVFARTLYASAATLLSNWVATMRAQMRWRRL